MRLQELLSKASQDEQFAREFQALAEEAALNGPRSREWRLLAERLAEDEEELYAMVSVGRGTGAAGARLAGARAAGTTTTTTITTTTTVACTTTTTTTTTTGNITTFGTRPPREP